MQISIFGMGYVGAVCAACWAQQNHSVIGVDVNPEKARLINQGDSPIIEAGLTEAIAAAVGDRLLHVTTNAHEAVLASELSMICVGTPSQANGSLDLRFVSKVCEDIGSALKQKSEFSCRCFTQHCVTRNRTGYRDSCT